MNTLEKTRTYDSIVKLKTCTLCGKTFKWYSQEHAWKYNQQYLCSYTCHRKCEKEAIEPEEVKLTELQTCIQCGKEKPLSEYYKAVNYKTGRMKTCKDCHRKRTKKRA